MNKIILITASFPYYPGEQFLETEVKYYDGLDVTILPMTSHSNSRVIPRNIKVDKYLINQSKSRIVKMKYLLKAFLKNTFVYKELIFNKVLGIKKIKAFVFSILDYQRFYDIFDEYFKNQKDLNNTVLYTYWNTEATYALQSLKKKYGYKLVSRIHGFDIYKERRPDFYMPLKHLFTEDIDKILTITESANEYLSKTYGFKSETLDLSRLGVDDYSIKTQSSVDGTLSIVSCSFLVDVKRIDKIIDAMAALAKKFPSRKFEWKHIGTGPLEKKLKEYAMEKLLNFDNIQYEFLGHVENQEVYEFYKNNAIDVFVNVSESEGVPVSIMEAMSCHIPIVAPNIGGISDMISNGMNGILLSEKCEEDELLNALSNIEFLKSNEAKENSYNLYLEKYSAKKNYIEFIETLKMLKTNKDYY